MRRIYNLQFTIYKAFGVILLFYILHFTFYISIQAFYVSNHACTGSTQQKQCSCDVLASDGFCDLNDSRTVCGECLEPDALPALPPPRTEIPVNPVQTSPSVSISPSLNPSPQTPSLNSNLPSKEEAAVYKVNQGTMPKEVIKQPETGVVSFFNSLLNEATKLLTFTGLFVAAPNDKPRYYAEAESLHQAQFPEEVREKKPDVVDTLKGYIGVGSSAGIYSTCTPIIEGVEQNIKSYEALCQKGSFPEGIYPIVDPTPTPTPAVNAI